MCEGGGENERETKKMGKPAEKGKKKQNGERRMCQTEKSEAHWSIGY